MICIYIYSAVDGYSGYIYCCKAGTNKRATTILQYHMDGIKEVWILFNNNNKISITI